MTVLNRFLDLISDTDFSNTVLEKGSPSSNKSSPLITDSSVTLLPLILILSTNTFSPSKTLNFTVINSFSIISSTLCSTNWRLFFAITKSNSFNNFVILNGE